MVDERERAGVAESGPEVEAVDGPKQWKQSKTELVEPTGVADGFFLRHLDSVSRTGQHLAPLAVDSVAPLLGCERTGQHLTLLSRCRGQASLSSWKLCEG